MDGYVADAAVFDETTLQRMFDSLVDSLEMRILLGPSFIEVDLDPSKLNHTEFADEGGITGFCVISTSHVSIHCWPLRKFFSMDVFSCKDFDVRKALDVIQRYLQVAQVNITNLDRAKPSYPGGQSRLSGRPDAKPL